MMKINIKNLNLKSKTKYIVRFLKSNNIRPRVATITTNKNYV